MDDSCGRKQRTVGKATRLSAIRLNGPKGKTQQTVAVPARRLLKGGRRVSLRDLPSIVRKAITHTHYENVGRLIRTGTGRFGVCVIVRFDPNVLLQMATP